MAGVEIDAVGKVYGGDTRALFDVSIHVEDGEELILGIRPEAFEIRAAANSGPSITVGTDLVEQLGSEAFVHFNLPSPPVVTADLESSLKDEGTDIESLGAGTKFTARVSPDHMPPPLVPAELVVDTSKLHFFDKPTGARYPMTHHVITAGTRP